ncbi:MAG TPA: hypothetical protein PLT03_01410 [Bacillota bacterium]|nr:hypothetical protein [Bacillota bacterium]
MYGFGAGSGEGAARPAWPTARIVIKAAASAKLRAPLRANPGVLILTGELFLI